MGKLADRRGSAAIEFALILPVLLMLYLGAMQVTLAFATSRRLNECSHAIADIVAQMHDVTVDDLKDALEVRFSMMAPFSDDRMGLRVSAVTLSQSGAAQTKWSIASNDRLAPFDKGSDVKIPDDLNRRDGTALIIINASYEYQFSAFGELLSEAADLEATAYSKPRARVSLDCPTC